MTDEFQFLQDTDAFARRTDPETSHDAAKSVYLTRLEELVFLNLKGLGKRGATSHELAEMLKLELVTISPRLRPLARKGFIIETAERRAGPSGRNSVVWKINSNRGG